jgi:hypothetical protein
VTYFLEESGYFTHEATARFILKLTQMTIGKEEISEEWRMNESLHNAIHEARVS